MIVYGGLTQYYPGYPQQDSGFFYVCDSKCYEKTINKRSFSYFFREKLKSDTSPLSFYFRDHLISSIIAYSSA
jgi:hypothetical protein